MIGLGGGGGAGGRPIHAPLSLCVLCISGTAENILYKLGGRRRRRASLIHVASLSNIVLFHLQVATHRFDMCSTFCATHNCPGGPPLPAFILFFHITAPHSNVALQCIAIAYIPAPFRRPTSFSLLHFPLSRMSRSAIT